MNEVTLGRFRWALTQISNTFKFKIIIMTKLTKFLSIALNLDTTLYKCLERPIKKINFFKKKEITIANTNVFEKSLF